MEWTEIGDDAGVCGSGGSEDGVVESWVDVVGVEIEVSEEGGFGGGEGTGAESEASGA